MPLHGELLTRKKIENISVLDFMRKMGLEPTRCIHHKILSLARLPVPTLPRMIYKELNNADAGDGT